MRAAGSKPPHTRPQLCTHRHTHMSSAVPKYCSCRRPVQVPCLPHSCDLRGVSRAHTTPNPVSCGPRPLY
jgi:hypothetical protein